MHKYEGFTITCDKCGSTDCYVWQDSFYIKLICNNLECNQEKQLFET